MSYAYVSRTSQPTRSLYRKQREQQLERAPVRKRIYDAAKSLGFPNVAWSAHRLWEDLFVVAAQQVERGHAAIVLKADARLLVRRQGGKMPASKSSATRMLQRRQSILKKARAIADLGTHLEPLFEPLEGADLWNKTPFSKQGGDTVVAPQFSTNHHKNCREDKISAFSRYGKQQKKSEVALSKKRVGGRFVRAHKHPVLLSPPMASTSLEKENFLNKGPSAAQPTTKAPDELAVGACEHLPPEHPCRVAGRRYRAEQRHTARRNASCEHGDSGRVESAMELPWTTKPSPKSQTLPPSLAASAGTNIGLRPTATLQNSPKQTTIFNAVRSSAPAQFVDSLPTTANARTFADVAAPEKASCPASASNNELTDEQLLSPETLALIPKLPFFMREDHRRTGRMMALRRLSEGLPAWESPEEAAAAIEQPRRMSEAESRGFRESAPKPVQATARESIEPLDLTPLPDDHLPADAQWLRWQLGAAPELARLAFRPEARGRYSRSVWRAAVGKLISRYRFQVQAPVAYLVAAAAEMAKPGHHDNRTSKFYSVAKDWSPSLRKFAMVEARAPGWLEAYGGKDDWY